MSGHKPFSALIAKKSVAVQERVADKARELREEMAQRELRTVREGDSIAPKGAVEG